jgi:hypothetical protein
MKKQTLKKRFSFSVVGSHFFSALHARFLEFFFILYEDEKQKQKQNAFRSQRLIVKTE